MLRMVSYPHRPQSGHIMCYLNRTYHVLPTLLDHTLDVGRRFLYDFKNKFAQTLIRTGEPEFHAEWLRDEP
jgi:hypothetical protein